MVKSSIFLHIEYAGLRGKFVAILYFTTLKSKVKGVPDSLGE